MDDPELLDEIRSYVAGKVAEGFYSDGEIIESATESFEDETGRDDLEPEIERLVAELSARHYIEQIRWDSPTDCDRLDRAFADLESRGIVARQNFSCCGNCGNAEIGSEIEDARANREVVGYTFYHAQDSERAPQGYLYLAFGATKPGPEPQVLIGQMIVETLTRAGFHTEWNGSPSMRILINGLDWKRRRTA